MPRSTRYTTRQRAAVLACLKERTGQYLGVQDVADAVKKLGVSVGLTTIYIGRRRSGSQIRGR